MPPRRYVETLFDEYAHDFTEHLVEQLRYQAHEALLRPLIRAARRYRAVLDLGCGPGLCGSLIHPLSEAIDGVDLQRNAGTGPPTRSVYRDLVHADLVSFLAERQRSADLIVAADVFICLGELSTVFQSVRRFSSPGAVSR